MKNQRHTATLTACRAAGWIPVLCAVLPIATRDIGAQGTLDDYRRAATVSQRYSRLTVGLVQGGANWIGDSNRFWYRVTVPDGSRFVTVDAQAWTKQPAFDHDRLASALSSAVGERYTAITLPFSTFDYANEGQAIEADANGSRWRCTITDYACTRIGAAQGGGGGGTFGRGGGRGGQGRVGGAGRGNASGPRLSPDSSLEAIIVNNNVAIRPAAPDSEPTSASGRGEGGGRGARGGRGGAPAERDYTLLGFDGTEGDAYQLNSIEWSPDSKKLVAYRRKPGYNRMVHYVRSSPTDQVQPKDTAIYYQKPGDVVAFNQPVIFDVETKKQIVVDNALFPNAYQITRPVWRPDSRSYTFEYNERGHGLYRVLEVDATTGRVRTVIEEDPKTFFAYRGASPGLTDAGKNWRHDIDDGREILWMSERDGWNHLYLYDGLTGRVKNQVTKGQWVVKDVDSVDVAKRQIYFRALGMNRGQDPYFTHFYRINFDGTGLVAYTEADGNHSIEWSPDRSYYVDTYSRVDLPTVFELRRASDRRILPLEKGDMSAALATGWRPPEVFVAKGRDGTTDIWGIIVRPFTFDPAKKYPVIEQIYAGPQGSFVPKTWGGGQNLISTAELGFVLVQIDGMGTNNRSKAFHDVAWKNLADAGFPDRILWHKAASAKYPWYDISRVGVYGGSAGGQNAAGAVLFHGDFYDAAFASSGCHDNRMDKIWWNEHWMGTLGPHYAASSNVDNAHRLKGRLFLAVGEMDTNVDPSSTMQMVDALIRARKDFELLVVPNGGHGATGPDGSRRRNDFFVRWLYGVNPPNWNAGATITTATGSDTGQGSLDTLESDPMPYGFFESPADDSPPFWWW
jgi:dipeptidyl aminopeptidase/acylaminoacyl peptidase